MPYNPPPTFVTLTPASAVDLNTLAEDIRDLDRRTSPTTSGVGTSESTTSTSYANLATVGPSVTVDIGANGLAWVSLYTSFQGNTIGSLILISYAITGGATYGPLDSDSVTYQVANALYSARYGATHLAEIGAIAPGSPARTCTFTMKYKVTSGTGTFQDRRIVVTPLGG